VTLLISYPSKQKQTKTRIYDFAEFSKEFFLHKEIENHHKKWRDKKNISRGYFYFIYPVDSVLQSA